MSLETIHFIITGGTIDSFYDGTKDTVVPRENSIIPEYVKSLKLYQKNEFSEVCMKDSRDLSISDLKKIKNIIEKSKHKLFIITHGTYTMPDSARYLKGNLKRKNCTIIFTGSMIPLNGFSNSDAAFNIGFAVSEVTHLEPGIYVLMNGCIYNPDEVIKLIKQGRFASIFNK